MNGGGEVRVGGSPPPSHSHGESIRAAANANPGQWVCKTYPNATSANASYYRQRGYEATQRRNGNGVDLWIRKPVQPTRARLVPEVERDYPNPASSQEDRDNQTGIPR